MNAIDKLRERDTVEAAFIVVAYDDLKRDIPRLELGGDILERLAGQIVRRLEQDEEPEKDDIPF